MRFIRTIIIAVLAIIFLVVATANREAVALRLLPEWVSNLFGRADYSVKLPLFLIVLVALAIGMVLGLAWEWMRESRLRRLSAQRAFDLAKLQREARAHVPPSDDVLAILADAPPPGQQQGATARPGLPATQ